MAPTATAPSTAPARTAPAPRTRTTPARRPRPARSRRRGSTPITGFVPIAAARTAGAVGGIADSGVLVWLTRGRLWIGLLGTLLVGIVGLNVMSLSFSASSSRAGQQADELRRQNSALRTQVAMQLSSEQVQAAAQKLGLVFAPAGSIRYLHTSSNDAQKAAERLRSGEFDASTYVPPAVTETATETAPPATAVATDPTATATPPPVTTPADPATTATDPAATATAPTDTAVATTDTGAVSTETETATTATSDGGAVGAP
jgi:hypothetical protein